MAYEILPNPSKNKKPNHDFSSGVRIQGRQMKSRINGNVSKYIQITLGKQLASSLIMTMPHHNLILQFGTGEDAGKLAITLDNQQGQYPSKRSKNGQYSVSIPAAVAQGRMLLEFNTIYQSEVTMLRAENKPRILILDISAICIKGADHE